MAPLPCSGRHGDRKSTRLNSSHLVISYAVFCLKKTKLQSQVRPQILTPMNWNQTTSLTREPSARVAGSHNPPARGGCCFFFFNDTSTTEIYTLSLHDALPI